MLSRVANSIYWMSRYLERAENVARLINVNLHLILDLGQAQDSAQWLPLVVTSGGEEDFNARYKDASEGNVVRFLTFDELNPNSILSCISSARENARTVRETIPSDMWESLNELYHLVRMHSRKRSVANLQSFYTHIHNANHLFAGLSDNVMSHGEGWHFMRLGKMLERADKTARILDMKYFLLLPGADYVDSPYDAVQWAAVLKSATAFEMYRKQFQRIHYRDVAQFLIFDPLFPRSMTHCVHAADASLYAITAGGKGTFAATMEMRKLQDMLASAGIEAVLAKGLHEFIDLFQLSLNRLDQSIYQSFFALQGSLTKY